MSAVHGQIQETLGALTVGGKAVVEAALGETEPLAALEVMLAIDRDVDALLEWVEPEVFDLVALQSPVGRDLRFLTSSLRIAQALERVGDLLVSVGRRADVVRPLIQGHGLGPDVLALGAGALDLLQRAAAAYAVFDADAAGALEAADDAVDASHARLRARLFGLGEAPVEPVVEMGLVARFLERVGDHGVVIGERVRFIARGVMRPGDADESTMWSPQPKRPEM